MTDKAAFPPDPIPFDDYYEWLKEFVANEDAQREVARYHAAVDRWVKETGGPRGQAYEEDKEAAQALYNYRKIGRCILERNGWPSVGDINFKRLGPVNKHGSPAIYGDRDIPYEMQTLTDIGEIIVVGGTHYKFPEYRADINDKENIRQWLHLWLSLPHASLTLKVDVGLR